MGISRVPEGILDFGRGLGFKTEQPKNKVRRDIETMHQQYVWENHLDVFRAQSIPSSCCNRGTALQ